MGFYFSYYKADLVEVIPSHLFELLTEQVKSDAASCMGRRTGSLNHEGMFDSSKDGISK